MKTKTLTVSLVLIVAMMFGALMVLVQTPWKAGASVGPDSYNSTTTPNVAGSLILLKTGFGTLGSVIVTGPRVGNFQLINATTSDVNKRTGKLATSTLLIADFPQTTPGNATSTGTHTYDVAFTDGLLFVGSGSVSTTTITWK